MNKERRVTYEQICEWKPCGFDGEDDGKNYTPQRIRRLMDGKESWTPHDIVALDIPWNDKFWALIRFLPEMEQHELGCRVAETCEIENDNLRDRRDTLIAKKRAWARGEISGEELDADLSAYRAAYWAADQAEDRAAYRAADLSADRAADQAADRAAYWAADQAEDRAAYERFCNIALELIEVAMK